MEMVRSMFVPKFRIEGNGRRWVTLIENIKR